jgi:hypothetical protein
MSSSDHGIALTMLDLDSSGAATDSAVLAAQRAVEVVHAKGATLAITDEHRADRAMADACITLPRDWD